MARIFGRPGGNTPRIDKDKIGEFFLRRAQKSNIVGPLSTVIYQDHDPDMAIRRDQAEKNCLLKKLDLAPDMRVIDLGCGNGRWTGTILNAGCSYVGTDQSSELVSLARRAFPSDTSARFVTCPIEQTNLAALGESRSFDRVLCFGVLIYLNDEDVIKVANILPKLASVSSKILLREPVGISDRLTLQNHHSTEMDQTYNAVYRTEDELLGIFLPRLISAGFSFSGSGDIYQGELNNRAETKQRWMVFER